MRKSFWDWKLSFTPIFPFFMISNVKILFFKPTNLYEVLSFVFFFKFYGRNMTNVTVTLTDIPTQSRYKKESIHPKMQHHNRDLCLYSFRITFIFQMHTVQSQLSFASCVQVQVRQQRNGPTVTIRFTAFQVQNKL